jgi:valyl-tRNA synthetase
VVRSHLEHGRLPWAHAAINGWVLDPDRKKMSKSRGRVVTPVDLLERYGSDAVRYWAAKGRPGTDTAFDPGQIKVGRRLAVKLLNASRFVLGLSPAPGGTVTAALDRAMLAGLAETVAEATAALDGYDHTRALERTEQFFWRFCDDYLELAKARAYGERGEPGAESARAALAAALSTLLRLLAPYLPFVTEEVWSWHRDGSVHRASWPDPDRLRALAGGAAPDALAVAAEVIGQIRKAKSDAKLSMRAEVASVLVRADPDRLAVLAGVADDLRAAGRVESLSTEDHQGSDLVTQVRIR